MVERFKMFHMGLRDLRASMKDAFRAQTSRFSLLQTVGGSSFQFYKVGPQNTSQLVLNRNYQRSGGELTHTL